LLRQETDNFIITSGRAAQNLKHIINYFYIKPVLTIKEISTETSISERTARNLIDVLIEKRLIKETTGNKRNRIFTFERYLNLFKK